MKIIEAKDLLNIKKSILKKLDENLINHGQETAYVSCLLGKELGYSEERLYFLRIASLLHDIGAYKTEEMNNIKQFELIDTGRHSIYGYAILNEIEMFKEIAPAILYHHHSYENIDSYIDGIEIPEEALLISLADRVSIFCELLNYNEEKIVQAIHKIDKSKFDIKHIEILFDLIENKKIIKSICEGCYKNRLMESINNDIINIDLIKEYLTFLPLTIDFFSFQTALHTISVSSITRKICNKLNLDEKYKEKIEIGAYLHDLGKICIPLEILEKEEKLTEKEFEIMKMHVAYTREILQESNIDEELIELACNHHEKLNGKGYNRGLKAEDLSIGDRIISVGDIFCALTERRTYKESFSKEKVLNILWDMVDLSYIDGSVVDVIAMHYDEFLEYISNVRKNYNNKIDNILNNYNYISEKMNELNLN
ncbi:MAG: HD domain-containing phosphohydrolase [Peptostreptococcaceae bacterium]